MKIIRLDKQIITFLLISFILPLICVLLTLNIKFFQSSPIKFITIGIQASSPSLAALITVSFYSKSEGLKYFLKRKYLSFIHWKILLCAFVIPFAIVFLTKLISFLLLKTKFELYYLSTTKLVIILSALVAEELGWRGFLQEKFDEKFKLLLTPLLIGINWALWHYHFFLVQGMDVTFILFLLECITHSYIYYFITKLSNGNVIPASLFHFSINLFFNIFLLYPQHNNGNVLPYVLYIIISFLVALIMWHSKNKKIKLNN